MDTTNRILLQIPTQLLLITLPPHNNMDQLLHMRIQHRTRSHRLKQQPDPLLQNRRIRFVRLPLTNQSFADLRKHMETRLIEDQQETRNGVRHELLQFRFLRSKLLPSPTVRKISMDNFVKQVIS